MLDGSMLFAAISTTTLMFKIANDSHPDILDIGSRLAGKARDRIVTLESILQKMHHLAGGNLPLIYVDT